MKKLLRQNKLGKRAADLSERWALLGVSVSPVSHDRYWLLIDRLKGGCSWPLRYTDDLLPQLRAFARSCDLLTVMGWNVEDEPALLIPADGICRRCTALSALYPDGYLLIDDLNYRVFLTDIDDCDGTYFDIVDLPARDY